MGIFFSKTSTPSYINKKVVIIGGGYGGAAVAKLLDGKMEVVVIEKKSFFLHNVAALRAITDVTYADKVLIPQDKLLKTGVFKHGEVTEVATDHVRYVDYSTNQEVIENFDYLVIATGSNNSFLSNLSNSASTAKEVFREMNNRVQSAEKILIVGGGAVGVELAGEIKSDYPQKEVTLVHSGTGLIDVALPASFGSKALEILQGEGVQVLLGERLVSTGQEPSTASTSNQYASISEVKRQTYQTTGGKSLEADLVFWATGTRLNNEPLLKNFANVINERGQIRVNKHLQVEGYEHIYATGDITNFPEIKMAAATSYHADVIVNNILYQNGAQKSMKEYAPMRPFGQPIMFLSIGRNHGVGNAGTWIVPQWVVTAIKSKNLLVPKAHAMWNFVH